MTEIEQLKKNAEQQFVKERMAELAEYLETLANKAGDTLEWSMRGSLLEGVAIVAYFVTLFLGMYLGLAPETIESIADWSFLVFFVTALRSLHLHAQWMRADGELDGCLRTLEVLKMLDDKTFGNRRRKVSTKSRFPRFKEFWERITSKNKQEQYANT